MDDKSIIRSILEPTISLDEFAIFDKEYGSDGLERGERITEVKSVEFPYILINDYILSISEVNSFEISSVDFLPTISLNIELGNYSGFLSTSFPKDGDLVSVFLRGRDDLFKPIRNDYLITNIEVTKSSHPEGIGSKIYLQGSLFIPGLYDETSFCEPGTSFQVLKKTAAKLGLGFATNVTDTADEMNWICANETHENFIKHIVDNSWLDENSFFTAFIDIYYHLNFVNFNTQLADETEALIGLADSVVTSYISDVESKKSEARKIMSNHPNFDKSPFYISTYKPVNNSSDIAKRYGYSYNLKFFEHNSLKEWEFPVTPLITEGSANSKVLLKGRPNEDYYKTQQRVNYLGIQYSYPDHNVHEHYYLAKVHNMMNMVELDKMNLIIQAGKLNLNFIRCEKLPIIMIIREDNQRAAKVDDELNEDFTTEELMKKEVVDKIYTGMYAIKGFTINYKKLLPSQYSSMKSALKQTFILTRREWPSQTGE